MGATSLQELFEHELGDVYFAEHRLVNAYESLIEVAKALDNEDAVDLLRETLDEEQEALDRLQEHGAAFDYDSIPA